MSPFLLLTCLRILFFLLVQSKCLTFFFIFYKNQLLVSSISSIVFIFSIFLIYVLFSSFKLTQFSSLFFFQFLKLFICNLSFLLIQVFKTINFSLNTILLYSLNSNIVLPFLFNSNYFLISRVISSLTYEYRCVSLSISIEL